MNPADAPTLRAPLAEVTTARLDLQHPRADHLDGLAAVFAKPEVWEYPFGRPFDRAESEQFLTNQIVQLPVYGTAAWIVVERETDRVVGYLGLVVPVFYPEVLPAIEVGWRLDPDVWGRGYATEGATAALDEAFGPMGLDQVCSLPQVDNVRSVAVTQRLGMRIERTAKLPPTALRGSVEVAECWITASEWRNRTS